MWRDVMKVLSDSMASTAAQQAELLARTAELASARSQAPAPAPAAEPVAVQPAQAQPAVSDELIMQMLLAASLRSQLESGALHYTLSPSSGCRWLHYRLSPSHVDPMLLIHQAAAALKLATMLMLHSLVCTALHMLLLSACLSVYLFAAICRHVCLAPPARHAARGVGEHAQPGCARGRCRGAGTREVRFPVADSGAASQAQEQWRCMQLHQSVRACSPCSLVPRH